MSVKPPPLLNLLSSSPHQQSQQQEDAEMQEQQSPERLNSVSKGSPKNMLGLTLPGFSSSSSFAHSVDSMLGHHHPRIELVAPPGSPPRRVILEAERGRTAANNSLKTPPLICEQGPSAPSSPTSPSPGARSAKRPCPLQVDALQRLDLLSPNYIPPSAMDHGKLPPVSPGYSTSDLGSSPRSSISTSHYSALGINPANWMAFRDYSRHHGGCCAGSADDESDCGGEKPSNTLLLFSPAPFSPFSDCGVADLNVASASATPFSSRSPNLSPSPVRRSNNIHFSFDQFRSRSSLSNHGRSNAAVNQQLAALIPQHQSLDQEARERSRSEGEALAGGQDATKGGEEERMDTGGHGHSTLSVPSCSQQQQPHAGQKRRLLQKSPRGAEEESGAGSAGGQQSGRQPTIEEPPPSPTLAELFQPSDLDRGRRRQVEDWIRQQTAALEAFRHSLIPSQQEANLLQVPTVVPQNSLEQLWPSPATVHSQAGPIRPVTLWRRSRSESDVSAATAAAAAVEGEENGGANGGPATAQRRASHQPQQAPLLVPLNEATHVCEHCGQGFSMHDRLAKHIASRHRDRSASMNDEGSRVHKCQLCPKSFGRSDMLTRHMRLHTGLKPYACQLCGQVFSRSDHLSTHQRTHTGEKPYRCPQCNYAASRRDMITRHMRTHLLLDGSQAPFTDLQIPPISELSLNPSPAGLPPPPSAIAAGPAPTVSNEAISPQPPRPVSPQAAAAMAAANGMAQTHNHQQTAPLAVAAPSLNEQLAKMLSAAVANGGAGGLLGTQMMLSQLVGQLPPSLRRSSPNLLSPGDHPSAFRPPTGTACTPSATSAALNPSAIAAASAAVQQLLSNQQQQGTAVSHSRTPGLSLSLPAGRPNLPLLLSRQNSIGGLRFPEQQQQPK